MNDMSQVGGIAQASPHDPFTFTGNWREFLPIALTNLALTIATLGIYRFWAKARERRYLWSRTVVIDDAIEWTGTGKEMFLGFLFVMIVFLPALLVLNFGIEALVLRGEFVLAGIVAFVIYAGLFYLYHVARIRALRYQLSRTYWHGIRGGSDDPGWRYGWSALWKMTLGLLTLGLMVPWAMARLWNERWGRMSFGPHPFETRLEAGGLFLRWLLIYAAPIVGLILFSAFAMLGAVLGAGASTPSIGSMVSFVVGALLFYLSFLLASLAFYAAFFRYAAAATSVAGLNFAFTARTKDWLKLILGNIGLVIVTLGLGLLFIPYRNWSFLVRHMEAQGEIDLALLTQSTTRAPEDAEGLANVFDIGGI